MNLIKNLSLLYLSILLAQVKSQTPAPTVTNTCTPGKCGACRFSESTNEQRHECSFCVNSVQGADRKCEGTSTGITNCMATSYGPDESGNNKSSCVSCNAGYHLNMNTNTCYETPVTENCVQEGKMSFLGIDMLFCSMCKNGFDLKENTDSSATSTTSCVAGTSIDNCVGKGNSTVCSSCDYGYYPKPGSDLKSSTCKKRETDPEKMCGDGETIQVDGTTYCAQRCNVLEGYYAVLGAVKHSNGSMVDIQKCEYVALTEEQKKERFNSPPDGSFLGIFYGFGFFNLIGFLFIWE